MADTPARGRGAEAPGASAASAAPPIDGVLIARVPPARLEPFLARTPLFRGFEGESIARLAPLFLPLEIRSGTALLRAGTRADGMGIVFSGEVVVRTGDAEVERVGTGESFGEAAILADGPSPYTVVAEDACRVLWIGRDEAQTVFGTPPASEAVLRRLSTQLARLCAVERAELPLAEVVVTEPLRTVSSDANKPAPAAPPPESAFPAGAVPFVEIADYEPGPAVLSMVPVKIIRQHRLLPLRLAGKKLTVGLVSPRNQGAVAELKRALQTVDLEVVAISADDFYHALVQHRLDPAFAPQKSKTGGYSVNPESLTFETAADTEREQNPPARAIGDEVIRFVNKILVAALDREASDIHIEPASSGPRIRFRVNGVLQDWNEPIPPAATNKTITARIKVLAGLDITERRLPQDGRIGFSAGKREVDLRVSTLPANRGEKIAMRVLEAGATRKLQQIFYEEKTLAAVRRGLDRPYGGIIVGGPTGSGKTSTLYAMLSERRSTRPDTNILTVEDPIEYRLSGITQVQVSAASGLTFARTLRSLLRQDPDVIVVGETRDQETAVLALEAAMTGHLVLTSIHANTAVAALQRLQNLGCSEALISQSVALILVQRLVRRLCQTCKRLEPLPGALAEALVVRKVIDRSQMGTPMPVAFGCEACNHTGQAGRAVVVESLSLTDELRNAIAAGRPLPEIETMALQSGALLPFASYAAALLERELAGATEVLGALAD
ncbi:MAG: ATPase, T2SS/T4P/T4SS family [Myxococcales bacterium]